MPISGKWVTFKITLDMKNAPIGPKSKSLWQRTSVLGLILSRLINNYKRFCMYNVGFFVFFYQGPILIFLQVGFTMESLLPFNPKRTNNCIVHNILGLVEQPFSKKNNLVETCDELLE